MRRAPPHGNRPAKQLALLSHLEVSDQSSCQVYCEPECSLGGSELREASEKGFQRRISTAEHTPGVYVELLPVSHVPTAGGASISESNCGPFNCEPSGYSWKRSIIIKPDCEALRLLGRCWQRKSLVATCVDGNYGNWRQSPSLYSN